ncbi:MAG TPA: UDP-N-acetylmuramate dehydrogenase [Armatimonadota bacterium]|jgi:UDP-N-acetylmuramate dehydrogenase
MSQSVETFHSSWGELPVIKGEIITDEPMSKHTSYGIGGPADVFAVAADVSDLEVLLQWAREKSVPVTIMGAGCNMLVSDRGVRGLVVRFGEGFSRVQIDGDRVIAGAAVRLPVLVKAALDQGLSGLEGLAGVPGTVGGAVCMNAGTPVSCIGDALISVKVLDSGLSLRTLSAKELGLRYRGSDVLQKGLVIIEAEFLLHLGNPEEVSTVVETLLSKRRVGQPVAARTAGSVFKNPDGDFAGRLLDAVGAKGLQIGSARVSSKHANFIENTGSATAEDVRKLIIELQHRVKAQFGVDLEPEVKLVGEW